MSSREIDLLNVEIGVNEPDWFTEKINAEMMVRLILSRYRYLRTIKNLTSSVPDFMETRVPTMKPSYRFQATLAVCKYVVLVGTKYNYRGAPLLTAKVVEDPVENVPNNLWKVIEPAERLMLLAVKPNLR